MHGLCVSHSPVSPAFFACFIHCRQARIHLDTNYPCSCTGMFPILNAFKTFASDTTTESKPADLLALATGDTEHHLVCKVST